jgi:hypothetical protein
VGRRALDGSDRRLTMNSPAQPPGWYTDPDGPAWRRYWDGRQWTVHQVDAATGVPTGPKRDSSRTSWGIAIAGFVGLILGLALRGSSGDQTTVTTTVAQPPVTQTVAAQPPQTETTTASARATHVATASAASPVTSRRVSGDLSKDCTIKCTSPDAAGQLDANDIWCAWRGPHVIVHATLGNNMNARVHLSIVPKYFIENGGQHGTSSGSDLPVTLGPHRHRSWTGDAGSPAGVPTGTPIARCAPRLEDIAIG